MSSRRADGPGDSLELLLDTICNAFGGILFLTILMAVLLRLSHPKSEGLAVPQPAQDELVALNGRFETVMTEVESLEAAIGIQAETRQRLASADLEQRYARLLERRQQRRTLDKEILDATQATAKQQQEIDQISARSDQLNQQLTQMRESVHRSKHDLEHEQRRRTQSVVPPTTRATSKLECALVVRYGRVYKNYLLDEGRFSRELNLDEFVILGEQDGQIRVTPNPTAGLSIDDSDEFGVNLRSKISRHAPGTWYICLVVWEDSFGKFLEIKRPLIAAGYELRIIPVKEGGSVSEGPVKDPQVQ